MASVNKRKWTSPTGEKKEAWIVRYLDKGGSHRQRTFERKKEADDYRRLVEREIDDGTHIARSTSRTINALCDEYLAHMGRRADDGEISAGHLESARRMLAYARPHIGEILVVDLKWEAVERYANSLRQQQCKFFKRRLGNVTIKKALETLGQAVGYGVRRNYAARNVVADARKEIGNLPSPPITPFSQVEMRRVLEAIEIRPPNIARRSQAFLRAVVYLGAMCGLRRGEILGLRWSRIDFEKGRLTVDASLNNKDILKETKTQAGMRVLPLPRMVAEALETWRPFIVQESRGLIFRTFRGGPIADHNLYTAYWHPLLHRAGFPSENGKHRHFHATRHFAGSAWLDGGIPLADVSRMLGHANTAITAKIYSHAIADIDHRAPAMEKIAGMICAPKPLAIAHDVRMGEKTA